MASGGEIKEKVFVKIFDRNYEPLCLYATRFVRDSIEAEDLVQEIFVRFWEMYQDHEAMNNARPVLYRMTRNICIDRAREKNFCKVDIDTVADKLEYYFQPESADDSKIDLLMAAIKNLPDKCRQVLIAICINDKKYKDVADDMQVSVNTIKTQLARGLKLLRESLNKEDFELFLTFFLIS